MTFHPLFRDEHFERDLKGWQRNRKLASPDKVLGQNNVAVLRTLSCGNYWKLAAYEEDLLVAVWEFLGKDGKEWSEAINWELTERLNDEGFGDEEWIQDCMDDCNDPSGFKYVRSRLAALKEAAADNIVSPMMAGAL